MTVYIVNKSNHDFSAARKFGEFHFLSEGSQNKFQTNNIFRQFQEELKDSKANDYIVLCSLNVMNSIACAIFARMHGTLNLLLYKNSEGIYIERNHVL